MKVLVSRKSKRNTKMLVVVITVATAAIVAVWLLLWLPNTPAKLSGLFIMTRFIINDTLGVTIEGRIKNSGLSIAKNVTIQFEFYDEQGNILAERISPTYDISPLSEKAITLRFKVNAWDFKWWFVTNP